MTDFKLTQQDAPRDQGELFRGIGDGKQEADLLVSLASRAGYAMVSDYLAASAVESDVLAAGGCITCWRPHNQILNVAGGRVYCRECGTHTVCRAVDIAAGDTPGPVSPRKEEP